MKLLLCISALFIFTSCANVDTAINTYAEKRAESNDLILKGALTVVCSSASIGSILRHYHGDLTKWAKTCSTDEIRTE